MRFALCTFSPVFSRSIAVMLVAGLATGGCKARHNNGSCVTAVKLPSSLTSSTPHAGGFIVRKQRPATARETADATDLGEAPERRLSASFEIRFDEEKKTYFIDAYTDINEFARNQTVDYYVEVYHKAGYQKIPVINKEFDRFRELLDKARPFAGNNSPEKLSVKGLDTLMTALLPTSLISDSMQERAEDLGICSLAADEKSCLTFGSAGRIEFSLPVKEIGRLIAAHWQEGQDPVVPTEAQITKALDRFVARDGGADTENQQQDVPGLNAGLKSRLRAFLGGVYHFESRNGLASVVKKAEKCREDGSKPFCEDIDKVSRLLTEYAPFFDAGCAPTDWVQVMERVRATGQHEIGYCGGTVLAKVNIETDGKSDADLVEELQKQESEQFAAHAAELYKDILAAKPQFKLASNYVYEETLSAPNTPNKDIKDYFSYAFAVDRPATAQVEDEDGTTPTIDFFDNFDYFPATGVNDGFYYKLDVVDFTQLNLSFQVGSMVLADGVPMLLLPVTSKEQGAGNISPRPPRPDIQEPAPGPTGKPEPGIDSPGPQANPTTGNGRPRDNENSSGTDIVDSPAPGSPQPVTRDEQSPTIVIGTTADNTTAQGAPNPEDDSIVECP